MNSTGFECSRGVDTLIRSETSLEKGITKSEFGNEEIKRWDKKYLLANIDIYLIIRELN